MGESLTVGLFGSRRALMLCGIMIFSVARITFVVFGKRFSIIKQNGLFLSRLGTGSDLVLFLLLLY